MAPSKRPAVLPLPRFINPASIEIGDTIRVAWSVDDVKMTREGKVAKRDYEGSDRVLTTASGVEILRWHPDYLKRVRVTLLSKAPFEQVPLFSSYDELKERIND